MLEWLRELTSSHDDRLQEEIRAREEKERSLLASEERFRLAAQALRGYVYDRDLLEDTVERSEGFTRVTGFTSPEAPPGSDWWESRIHPQDLEQRRATAVAAYKSGASSYSCEYRLRHKSGDYIWVWEHAILVRDVAGRVKRIVGNIIDVSDRKQAEADHQALLESEQAARSEAERANRLKDEFLGVLSHELRTPLSTIRSWATILKMNPTDAAQVAKCAEIIERNVQIQTQLIGDLLDMNRIAAGKLRLEVQPVDIATVVRAAIETVRPAAESKNIEISCAAEPVVMQVHGDATRLQQAVWNLLANAIKFTPKEGRVNVKVGRVESQVQVAVSDTGRGISPDLLPEIFDRFRQSDWSSRKHEEGLGLGLAIVKQLIELHGGTVRAESSGDGEGATFTIELPVPGIMLYPAVRAPMSLPALRLDGATVLVVDDQVDAAAGTARLLESAGAAVFCSQSVDEALEMLKAYDIDIIVSDIGMPQRDGFNFIRALRETGDRTPMVALTAFARSEDRSRTLTEGFELHVSKPADPAELIAAVANVHARVHRKASGY
jgi:PAS domain S-box-containing protein